MGVFHTKSILECDFWWPGLSTFVKHFVAGCAVCQQNKVNTHPTIPPLCPISSTISLPFKQLSVDLVTVEEAPTSFSPFSLVDGTLLSHFSFNDFVTIAFLDLTGDLDSQI